MTKVAALFVEKGGPYAELPHVDLWDVARDAREYDGPWPVVAHPPCGRWVKPLALVNETRYGHRVGDDGGCFAAALDAVHRFGGVIEHPAHSIAWERFSLPAPSRGGWTQSMFDDGFGWATEVSQVAYGGKTRKRTWLYFRGPSPPAPLEYAEPRHTHLVVVARTDGATAPAHHQAQSVDHA